MLSTLELSRTLPAVLTYLGDSYNLVCRRGHYSNTIQLCYCKAYCTLAERNILRVDNTVFLVEAERHYATFFMLQLVLNYNKVLLQHLQCEDIRKYALACKAMLKNMQYIEKVIQSENVSNSRDNRYGDFRYVDN